MHSSDDKVVSISFNNKEFLTDVSTTIKALEQLNDVTSGKNLKTTGLENLGTAFNDLNKSATKDIDSINDKMKDNSATNSMADNVSSVGSSFNTLEVIAVGALLSIGDMAVQIGSRIAGALTQGIRDGWQEYNLIIDSTQTIFTNTKQYGSTIDDVVDSLDELNEYADLTIYNFAQMTRNMGYFTTTGMDLDAAQNMVMGMSNLAAMFGVQNEALQRAMYQTSQAMSAGYFRKMDWMSLRNATMNGQLLQDELIRVAGLMSGRGYDAMQKYIDGLGGFENSLQYGWLTADIFAETMRRFAGLTEEEAAAIRDINNQPLPIEEQQRIVQVGIDAAEAAKKVRTFRQMMESLNESIGSGWGQTFRLIIGNLEEAKEFWSPINNVLTSVTNGLGNYRNSIVGSWAIIYRSLMVDDLITTMNALKDVLFAIGNGFANAFGGTHKLAARIGQITEAIGDLSETLKLDEEELQDVTDLVTGLVSPFTLLGDIVYEVVRALFNAGDAMNEFDTRTNSFVDNFKPIRKAILSILGLVGRTLTAGVQIIRKLGIIQKSLRIFANVIKAVANVMYKTLSTTFILLRAIWNKYDITNKLIGFYNSFINYIYSLKPYINEISNIFTAWLSYLKYNLSNINFTPLEDLKNILEGLKNIFIALVDPTKSVTVAIEDFKEIVSKTSIYKGILFIKSAILELYQALKESDFGFIFDTITDQALTLHDKILVILDGMKGAFKRFYAYIKTTRIPSYLDSFKNSIIHLYKSLKNTRVGKFILSIAEDIKNAIVNLKNNLEGTKIGEIIDNFVSIIRNTLASDDAELKEPNVFTLIKDVLVKVKDVIDDAKNLSLEPVERVIDSVKSATDKVKEVTTGWMPEELISKTQEGGPKIIAVLDSMVQFVSDILAFGLGHVDLENKVEQFSERLNFFASPDREQDATKIQKISEILEVIFSAMRTLLLNLAAFTAIIVAINASISFIAIAEAFENLTSGFEQWAKAKKYNAISKIFDSIFKLALVLVLGVYLLSTIDDFDRVKDTLLYVTASIVVIIGTCIIGIELILLSMNNLLSMENPLSALGNASELSKILSTIGGYLNKVMWFIARLSFIALAVAKLSDGQQETFFKALNKMVGVFLLIAAALTVIIGVCFFFAQEMDEVDTSTKLFNKIVGRKLSGIEAAAEAMATVGKAISGLMIAIGVAMAIIMIAAPNNDAIWASGIMLGLIAAALIFLMEKALFIIKTFDETNMMALEKLSSSIGVMSYFLLALAGAITLITLSIAVLATALKGMDGWNMLGLWIMFASMSVVLLGFLEEAFSMAQSIGRNQAKASDMILMATSIGIVALAMTMIINALVPLAALSYIEGFAGKIALVSVILAGLIAGIGAGLMYMTNWVNSKAFAASNLIITAGSIAMVASTLLVISAAILSLSALPFDKLAASSGFIIGTLIIIGTILLAITSLAFINPAIGGIASGVILAVGASIMMMGSGILMLGKACKEASIGMLLFANALQTLSTVDGNRVADNIIAIFRSIPAFFSEMLANFVIIKLAVLNFFDVLGEGIAQVIRTIFGTINNLIAEFLAQGIYIFIDLFDKLFPAILVSVHNNLVVFSEFIAAECGPGGTLRQLIVNLGDFLVWAGGYLAEFSVDIIEAIIGGLVTALSNTYFFDRLAYTIVNMFMQIKYRIWQDFGIMSWSDLGALIGNALVTGFMNAVNAVQSWYNNFMGQVADGLATLARASGHDDEAAIHEDVARQYYEAAEAYDNTITDNTNQLRGYTGQLREENREAMELEMAGWESVMNQSEQSYRASRNQNRAVYDEQRAASSYDPSAYYAGLAHQGEEDYVYHNAGGQAGESFGGGFLATLGNIFTGGSSLTDLLGLGSIGDAFGDLGSESGSSFLDGFGNIGSLSNIDLSATTENLGSIENMDFSNIEGLDANLDDMGKTDYSNISSALVSSVTLPEDVTSPTITPVLDSSSFETDLHDLSSIVDNWNGKNIDELAVDVGKTMTIREEANGDAATNGAVSYNFTQINQSPEALSPIQIYRDTNNLVRARLNIV